MTTEALKATSITNLDATPPVRTTEGQGAAGYLREIEGVLTATTAKTSGSTYQMVRVPSNSVIKHVLIWLDASVTTFTADTGFYYSDTSDGTILANQGTKVNSNTGAQLYGAGVAYAAQVTPLDVVVTGTGANRQVPAWKACGLTSDPGGFFDLVLTTTTTTSGAPVINAEIQYVIPMG